MACDVACGPPWIDTREGHLVAIEWMVAQPRRLELVSKHVDHLDDAGWRVLLEDHHAGCAPP